MGSVFLWDHENLAQELVWSWFHQCYGAFLDQFLYFSPEFDLLLAVLAVVEGELPLGHPILIW